MSDTGPTDGPNPATDASGDAAPDQTQQPLAIIAQYTKDLSFEVPGAPQVFIDMQNAQPDINVNIDVRVDPVQEPVYEVQVHINAECTVADKPAFICELVYAGLFQVNVPREHLQAILLIECPRMLFPFARNIVADATRDGGFPPLMLAPVDFVSMYQNQVAQQAQAGGEGQADA